MEMVWVFGFWGNGKGSQKENDLKQHFIFGSKALAVK